MVSASKIKIASSLLMMFSLHFFAFSERAPRPGESAGIENPALTPEEGLAVCCPLPRDVNIIGDLYVGGNVTINGLVFGNSGICNNTLLVKEGTLHGPNEFNSVKAAVDSITTNSATNPFVVKICPGVYIEDTITLKPYIGLTTDLPGEATIQASNPANTIIVMAPFSVVQGIQLQGATNSGSAAITFSGGIGGCLIQNCFFGSNDILVNQTATVGPSSVLFLESCIIWSGSQFTTGFQIETTGSIPAIFKGCNLDWLQSNNALLNQVFNVSGSLATLILESSDFGTVTLVPAGIGIQVQNGGNINLKSMSLAGFATAINVPNVGAGPNLKILASTSNNCTNDIVISNPGTSAVIEGIFDDKKISIVSGASVAMFILDPVNDATVTVGNQYVGNVISEVTNITPSIQQGATLGVITGGTLVNAGGLNVQVLAGAGYLMVGTAPNDYLQYTTWNTQTIALPANTVNFIWIDNTGTVQFGTTASDPITTIPLGKAETETSIIAFLQEQPQEATHLATNLDITLQNGLGPIYNYGSIVTLNGTDQLNVSPGNYFYGSLNFMPSGGTPVSWDAFYQNGSGGQNIINGQNAVPYTQYDNGSGTLASIPANEYTVHAFYVVNDGVNEQYLLVYGQTLYTTLSAAQAGGIPPEPGFWTGNIALIASIIVENNVTTPVVQITDQRPRLGFKASGVTAVTPLYQTNSGNASPNGSGILQIFGGPNISTSGAGNLITIGVSGTTQYAVQVGNASGSLSSLGVGSNGQVLLGSTGVNPVFATLTSSGSTLTYTPGAGSLNIDLTAPVTVPYGGTGQTSFTAYELLASGTTTTGAFQQIASGNTTLNYVLISNGAGALPTFQPISSSGVITTIDGNSGSLTPTAGVVTIEGGNNINTTGAGSTLTVNVAGTTQYAVQVGNAGGSLSSLGVGTNGQVLLGSTGADPVFATLTSSGSTLTYTPGAGSLNIDITAPITVPYGGTGQISFTAYELLAAGTTITGAFQQILSDNTTLNYVLTSNGVGALPTFQPVSASGAIMALEGDNGETASGATVTIAGGSNISTAGNNASTLTVNLVNSPSVSGSVTAGTGFVATTGDVDIIAGNLDLPNSTATKGNITKAGTVFLQNFGTNNIFMGSEAGNFTLTGDNNIGIGGSSLSGLTNGTDNIGLGTDTLLTNTAGIGNIAIGSNVLNANTSGSYNVGIGLNVLALATVGSFNLVFGENAMSAAITTGSENVAIGASSLRVCTSGFRNMAIGNGSLGRLTTGGTNVSIGYLTAQDLTTGSNNVCIGSGAGQNYTTESNNIVIGSFQGAVAGDAGVIRIGVGPEVTTSCYIQGINGVNVGSVASVLTNSGDQLGTATITAGTGITVTPGSNSITLATAGSVATSFVAGSGTATPSGGALSVPNGSNINTTGAGSTLTINLVNSPSVSGSLTAGTGVTSTIGNIVATAGQVNAGATITAGTGITATTGNITATSGNVAITAGNLTLPNSTATTGNITKAGTVFMHNFGSFSTYLGINAGNLTNASGSNTGLGYNALSAIDGGSSNVAIGNNALFSTTTGIGNIAAGLQALNSNSSGSYNVALGYQALINATTGNYNLAFGQLAMGGVVTGSANVAIGASALTTATSATQNLAIGNGALEGVTSGASNVSIGYLSGTGITTGSNNVFIGLNAGNGHAGGTGNADSGNINIGAGQSGVAGESFVTRIGNVTGTATTACFIGGIRGVTTANNNAIAVLVDSAGQLGTVSSSRRYKENITDLENSEQQFMQLRPVQFNYKKHTASDVQYGLIAEEVQKLYPELVVDNEDGEPETIKYHLLYALLIKMIQENRKLSEENRLFSVGLESRIQELFALYTAQNKLASCS